MDHGDARADYERVFPDLETGYGVAKDWMQAGFDPRALARAESGWWVARRTPGQNSPEQVRSLMADAYALLYEVPRARVMRAAVLRAQAAALRDAQAERPNWETIGQLLRESYADLQMGVANDGSNGNSRSR